MIHGDQDRDPAPRAGRGARAGDRRRAGDARGRRPPARSPATRSRSTCCSATSSARRRRRLGGRARASRRAAGAVRLLADRARARAARRRDRRRAAPAPPRPRDRLARAAPRDRGARGARASGSTRQRRARQRVGPLPVRVAPGTTCTASRRCGGWTRSCWRTSWSSTTSSATSTYDLWIGDEAWDARLLPAREPRAEDGRLRVADRLRRLPADARRRRARGVADRRLQRRDDRARSRASRACATARSSSATRTTSSPTASAPGCRRSATGPSSTSASPATSPALTRPRSPTADALRAELGYGPDEQVCIVTVGGSGVGEPLLRRVIDSFPEAKRLVPQLRMIVVAGPRIDPATLPPATASRSAPYVHDLYRHLAACDLAVVQGGLTHGDGADRQPAAVHLLPARPPLRAELPRRTTGWSATGAGRRMDFDNRPRRRSPTRSPRRSAATSTTARSIDGAARAAALIAELL